MKKSIHEKVEALVKKHGTRNPEELASSLGIKVVYNPEFSRLKGFYSVILRSRFIVINDNLSPHDKRIVLSHEIGHDILHRALAGDSTLREFVLYDMKSRPEYEANLFAAELLLTDAEVLTLAKEGFDIEQMSKILNTDINLAAIKLSAMNSRGYNFNTIPPKRNFLGR